jgi:hypothetical protein
MSPASTEKEIRHTTPKAAAKRFMEVSFEIQ